MRSVGGVFPACFENYDQQTDGHDGLQFQKEYNIRKLTRKLWKNYRGKKLERYLIHML